MKTVMLLAVGFTLGVVSCVVGFVGKVIFIPSPREALPFFATCREERCEYGFLNDFSHKIEAEITEAEFQKFVRKMRFPESSQKSPHLFIIDKPRYQKKAKYVAGKLHFEEFEE